MRCTKLGYNGSGILGSDTISASGSIGSFPAAEIPFHFPVVRPYLDAGVAWTRSPA